MEGSSRGQQACKDAKQQPGLAGRVQLVESTETLGLLGTGAQDRHLDFHTAPELCSVSDAWTYICTGQWTDWFLIFNVTVNCEDQLGVQELCERGGGRPGLPVAKKPDGFCGRKATLKREGYISAKLNPIRACLRVLSMCSHFV